MDPLEFRMSSAHVVDDVYVVTLAGELDLANVSDIDRELDAIGEQGAGRVIVDLLEVPFIESRTLGVLVQHARRLRADGGELTLVSDDARVLRVIELTGFGSHFRMERTLAGAVDGVLAQVIA